MIATVQFGLQALNTDDATLLARLHQVYNRALPFFHEGTSKLLDKIAPGQTFRSTAMGQVTAAFRDAMVSVGIHVEGIDEAADIDEHNRLKVIVHELESLVNALDLLTTLMEETLTKMQHAHLPIPLNDDMVKERA